MSEGDRIVSGDLIAEIETDKAVMEFEAVDDGTIGKILVPEGSTGIEVNRPIALLVQEGEDVPEDLEAFSTPHSPEADSSQSPDAEIPIREDAVSAGRAPTRTPAQERIFASPLARRIAREKGLDLRQITGSGPNGRIVKRDVERSTVRPVPMVSEAETVAKDPERKVSADAVTAIYKDREYEVVKLDGMRRTNRRQAFRGEADNSTFLPAPRNSPGRPAFASR